MAMDPELAGMDAEKCLKRVIVFPPASILQIASMRFWRVGEIKDASP